MLLKEERELIVEYGKKIVEAELTTGTGGNLSIYNREHNLYAISPSGIDYYETTPEDIVVMDMNNEVVDGKRKPSSEYLMHSTVYKNRKDVNSVIHTHSMFSTTMATLGWDLPASNYYIAIAGGNNVRCAKYGTFGTQELGDNAVEALKERFACYLANHGLLTVGKDIESAFEVAVNVEHITEAYVRAKAIGEPIILSDEEIDRNLELFKSYGQK